jgi:hypothetical protein
LTGFHDDRFWINVTDLSLLADWKYVSNLNSQADILAFWKKQNRARPSWRRIMVAMAKNVSIASFTKMGSEANNRFCNFLIISAL